MRVSLEWLNEYVDITGLTPETIASALTNAGLEVEAIDYIGPKFNGVVVGKVLALKPHPNADKLRLVTVDLGISQTQVVCGAPNVREDLFIAFATEGAQVLSRKDNTLFTLGRAKIRGVESAGMLCSLEELGLETQFEKQEDGIWPLNPVLSNPTLGQDLKEALKLQGDVVLEVAPTANRGDLMSMLGVAREVAALFDRPLKPVNPPECKVHPPAALAVELSNPAVCGYYAGASLSNIQIGPAPEWMSRRLVAAGVRSINNVVDITNYVMLEMGQPLHAFDQNKLGHSGTVDVRTAQPEEKLTTLDDVERSLTAESVVISLNGQAVALAGLMGGAATEIDDHSTALFLESAYFLPSAIRKSAKSVGLRSEASARFERGVDSEQCEKALNRAIHLLEPHANAKLTGISASSTPSHNKLELPLNFAKMERWLGLSIPPTQAASILEKLGFGINAQTTEELRVLVPSFRQVDVTREIDLVEEVVRIFGYDKVPYTLPQKTGSSMPSLRATLLKALSQSLRSQGLQEVMTTSLIGESLLEKTGFTLNREQQVSVINSHSSDHTVMRQSLLPNLLEVAKFNQAQGNEAVWIYELGRTYFKLGKANHKNAGVSEKLSLSGLITGGLNLGGWHHQEPVDFYTLKGLVENLVAVLKLQDQIEFKAAEPVTYLHPGKSAQILCGEKKKPIGILGELHPEVSKRLKFRQAVYVFELDVETIYKALKQSHATTKAVAVSHFPAIKRDMAFVAEQAVRHQDVLQVLHASNEPLLHQVELFDEYRSEQLGSENRSLAYRLTFQSTEGTMTDVEVDQRFQQLKSQLSEKLAIQFR